MRILITGLCTVHWGRMENGNIGNYYIIETTVRELHRVFPKAEIVTTFQMTKEFCDRENVTVMPMEAYYSWSDQDVNLALQDFALATLKQKTSDSLLDSPFVELVKSCDLVCDFSGEMWGDHADPVGDNRFLVNLLKMRTAQLIGKKTVLLAGSQGPFKKTEKLLPLAKEVIENFDLILGREKSSIELLQTNGFNVSKASGYTDPAFLFQPFEKEEIKNILQDEGMHENESNIGFVLCGFNMLEGPYDKEPRLDSEFDQFVELVEYTVTMTGARVYLMSHQNGFDVEDGEIKLKNGRDYPYGKRLEELVHARNNVPREKVKCVKGPYNPKETKAIINQFDMFISGRIHAFVAATSQSIPTVIINRGHGGRSHRNIGFAKSVGLETYISDPSSVTDMQEKVKLCWDSRIELRQTLEARIPEVKKTAHKLFDQLKTLY